jgi:hypothetical protein
MTIDRRSKSKSEGLAGHVNAWLESWGFLRNPFESWDADREDLSVLRHYYIKPPFYEQLLTERKSALIFAQRGGGKSAARIMLQSECLPLSKSSTILAVPFTDFSPFAEDFTSVQAFTLQDYLKVIIRTSITQLFAALCTSPNKETFLNTRQLGEFVYWLDEYVPRWKSTSYLNDIIRIISSLEERSSYISRTWQASNQTSRVGERDPSVARMVLLWQKLTQDSPYVPKVSLDSSSQIMAAFVQFCLNLLSSKKPPCQAVYLLIDGIDEYLLTQDDPQAGADLIKPMLGNIRFLEISGLAVKFFLPMEYQLAFGKVTRPDRLPSYTITWRMENEENETYARMRKLLRTRLWYYSRGEITSLAEMCTPELRHVIEDALLEEAKGIPRFLLQLGNQIFIEHCREVPESESEITTGDWERALDWFRGTIIPSELASSVNKTISSKKESGKQRNSTMMQVDLHTGRVYIAGNELPALPKLEHKLLNYLYRRRGSICSRDEIIRAVYGDAEGITDETLGSLVYRLRNSIHKLAPGLPKTHFIETASRRGYMLKNVT